MKEVGLPGIGTEPWKVTATESFYFSADFSNFLGDIIDEILGKNLIFYLSNVMIIRNEILGLDKACD